jgi:hypothetical protein
MAARGIACCCNVTVSGCELMRATIIAAKVSFYRLNYLTMPDNIQDARAPSLPGGPQ